MLELQQQIWDGGGIRMQKKKATAEAEIDREKLNVDMYALNGRVNDLYFGILMLDEQLAQNALLQDELGRNFRQITAYVENGIANQADLDAVKVGKIKALSGMSPNDYLKTLRMNRAAELIVSGTRISEVAAQVGFTSSSYFAKCFKAQYGVLPKEYTGQPPISGEA